MSNTARVCGYPRVEDFVGNIGTVVVGGTPSTTVEKYWDGDIPWMASGDIHLRRVWDVPTRISALGLRHSNATLVEPPAVAIALAGQGRTRGTVALILSKLCTNQSVALIVGDPQKVNAEYLFFNLESRYDELRSRSAGGGRAGLTKQLIEHIPVALPSLPEQARIVEILSTVDRVIEQTDALIAKHRRIKSGLLQDLLSRGIDEHGKLRADRLHPPGKEAVNGESAPYLGREYQIQVTDTESGKIEFSYGFRVPPAHQAKRREVLRDWYVEKAKEKIIARVEHHARDLGVEYSSVKIVDSRYRWGSCTASDNVSFNWRLIKAPMFVIDYVVIHELAHLMERSHTDRFWNIVRAQTPTMDKAKTWLREYGQMLEEEI